jgi:predicted CopG family antitoxin
MANRLFAERTPSLNEMYWQFADSRDALRAYYAQRNALKFAGYTVAEINQELEVRLNENALLNSLSLIAFIEAFFRVDFLHRVEKKKKDPVSRVFRALAKRKKKRISLDEDIFETWSEHAIGTKALIGQLRSVFRYRHWLAHGRYWDPKLAQNYDYETLFELAEIVYSSFSFLGVDEN